jgi:hypothetical protein
LGCGGCCLGGFTLGMKEVDEVLDLVRLKNISEGGHGSATIVNLMLDLLLVQAFADGAEVWA